MKISCRSHSNHAVKCVEKLKALDKVHARCIPVGRSDSNFPKRLSGYTLLESSLQNVSIRSMASYSNNGAIMTIHPSAMIPYDAVDNSKKNNEERRRPSPPHAQYERMNKLNKKFSSIMNVANSKIRALQIDLSRMEDISQEFNEISRQSTTTQRVKVVEENMFRFEENLTALNSKLNEITASQRKLTNLLGRHSDTLKMQHKQSNAGMTEVQNRLMQIETKISNYQLDSTSLAEGNSETQRKIVKMERVVAANMDVMVKQMRRMQFMQKGILSITAVGGLFVSVLMLNCAEAKYFMNYSE